MQLLPTYIRDYLTVFRSPLIPGFAPFFQSSLAPYYPSDLPPQLLEKKILYRNNRQPTMPGDDPPEFFVKVGGAIGDGQEKRASCAEQLLAEARSGETRR